MDCEGFDEIVLDLLYEDTDAPHLSEARRHADGCLRCAGSLAALQQARQATELAPMPVPAGLERSILAEVERRRQAREATWWGRVDRAISLLGAFAMRPQTAMGALLVLMTGLSLVLLRARPADRGTVRITEDGRPAEPVAPPPAVAAAAERRPVEAPSRKEEERAKAADLPATPLPAATREIAEPAPPAAASAAATTTAQPSAPGEAAVAKKDKATAPGDSQEAAFAAAMEHYKARRYGDAMRAFDIVANGGGSNGGLAALYAARSARYSSGCLAALPRFNAIANRQVGSSAASEATWEAATCYRELGQAESARQLFSTLRRVAGYRDRVEKELAALEQRSAKEPAPAAAPAGARPAPRLAPPEPQRRKTSVWTAFTSRSRSSNSSPSSSTPMPGLMLSPSVRQGLIHCTPPRSRSAPLRSDETIRSTRVPTGWGSSVGKKRPTRVTSPRYT